MNTIQMGSFDNPSASNISKSINFKNHGPMSLNPYDSHLRSSDYHRKMPSGRPQSPLTNELSRHGILSQSQKCRDMERKSRDANSLRGQRRLLQPLPTNALPSPRQAELNINRRKETVLKPFSKHYLAVAGEYENKVKSHKKTRSTVDPLRPTTKKDLRNMSREIESLR